MKYKIYLVAGIFSMLFYACRKKERQQRFGTIHGIVYDVDSKDSSLIPNATVTLFHENLKIKETKTNVQGEYSFSRILEQDGYKIKVFLEDSTISFKHEFTIFEHDYEEYDLASDVISFEFVDTLFFNDSVHLEIDSIHIKLLYPGDNTAYKESYTSGNGAFIFKEVLRGQFQLLIDHKYLIKKISSLVYLDTPKKEKIIIPSLLNINVSVLDSGLQLPVKNATVFLNGPINNSGIDFPREVTQNTNGLYTVKTSFVGQYYLRVESENYVPVEKRIEVLSGMETMEQINIKLKPKTTVVKFCEIDNSNGNVAPNFLPTDTKPKIINFCKEGRGGFKWSIETLNLPRWLKINETDKPNVTAGMWTNEILSLEVRIDPTQGKPIPGNFANIVLKVDSNLATIDDPIIRVFIRNPENQLQ